MNENDKKNKAIFLNKTNKAFTIAEIMIVLVIIGIISTWTYGITQSKASYYKTRYMAYSAFMNLQNGIGLLLTAGCNSNNVAVCPKPGDTSLPIVGHDTNSPPFGLCDRLIPSATSTGAYNTLGKIYCDPILQPTIVIPSGTLNFSSYTPNFTTTNGMMFYNFSSNPDPISKLYTVYVDIDGKSQGSSSINSDVIAFTFGTDGKIVPAYNTVAATNPAYLPASAGYINSSETYVGVDNGVGYQTAYCDVYGTYPNAACAKHPSCITASCKFMLNKPPGIK